MRSFIVNFITALGLIVSPTLILGGIMIGGDIYRSGGDVLSVCNALGLTLLGCVVLWGICVLQDWDRKMDARRLYAKEFIRYTEAQDAFCRSAFGDVVNVRDGSRLCIDEIKTYYLHLKEDESGYYLEDDFCEVKSWEELL